MNAKINSDRILSISAIIIAAASIIVTVWEGYEIRHHNHLSVRPKLEIFLNYTVDKPAMEWILVNNGIGPGIILSSTFTFDGKKYPVSGGAVYSRIIEENHLKDVIINKVSSLNAGLSIKAESMRPIVSFELTDEDMDFWKLHNRIQFEIEYESMYGERFTCYYPMN